MVGSGPGLGQDGARVDKEGIVSDLDDGGHVAGRTAAARERRRSIVILTALGTFLVASFVVALAFVQGWLPLQGGDSVAAPGASRPTTACSAPVLPAPKTITLNVYNATNRPGLAGTTAKTLKDRGFAVASVANDPLQKSVAAVAEIRYGKSGAVQAEVVALRFPGAVKAQDGRPDASVDVAIGEAFAAVGEVTAPAAPTSC